MLPDRGGWPGRAGRGALPRRTIGVPKAAAEAPMQGLRPAGTLFISDLHLDPGDPAVVRQFNAFLATDARRADALYILGDLFEAWLGDDDPDPFAHGVVGALRSLTDAGVPCFVMHGNRDFLIGRDFCRLAGCTLLAALIGVGLMIPGAAA
jgi:predicted MPP superfamily phosphohydrolase